MPVHINMSPLLFRIMRIVFMKLLGSTSLVLATFISFTLVVLIALLDVDVFENNGFADVSLADDQMGGVLPLKERSRPTSRSPKFRHVQERLDAAEHLVGTEWNVENYSDVYSSGPVCSANPLLLIIVTSAPDNFDRRKAIRNTWARYRNNLNSTHHKTVFLIGRTTPSLTVMLESENQKHKDILFGDYTDSYRNLTIKVQHGIKWAAKSCQPQYLLKTDDDCFVNTRHLVSFLQNHNRHTTGLYVGHQMTSLDVVRNPSSKWFVSRTDYARESYPPYASGTGYLVSSDVLKQLVSRSTFHRPFPVEDAYTGVLAESIGVKLIDTPRFALLSSKWTMCNYLYLFVVHNVTPGQQYVCLRYAEESGAKCTSTEALTEWE